MKQLRITQVSVEYVKEHLKDKNIYRILICDDGIKIDNDAIYKIGNYYTNKEDGNGIGTSLIKKIISMHSGKIKYRNNKNKGVSVYITLTLS